MEEEVVLPIQSNFSSSTRSSGSSGTKNNEERFCRGNGAASLRLGGVCGGVVMVVLLLLQWVNDGRVKGRLVRDCAPLAGLSRVD